MRYKGNKLVLDSGCEVLFDHGLKDVLEFGEIFVVLLSIPVGTTYNRNVFGISKADGRVLWQIQPTASIVMPTNDNPYVGIGRKEDGAVSATTFDGITVYLDPISGKEVRKWSWTK